MTSSEIFKRENFCGTKILWNIDIVDIFLQQKRLKAVAWFAESEKLKMSKFEYVLSKVV